MQKKLAIQGDSLKTLNLSSDTSLFIASVLYNKGYRVFWYHPQKLRYKNGKVLASGTYIKIWYDEKSNPILSYEFESKEIEIELNNFSCIMIRQNPPLDIPYIASTHLLSLLKEANPEILFINNPEVLRDNVEKFLPISIANTLQKSTIIPPTLISSEYNSIKNFLTEQQHIVMKPIYGYGGNDVIQVKVDEENKISEYLGRQGNIQVIAQQFLHEIYDGDKRVIVSDGEIIGSVGRKSAADSFLTNTRAGGIPYKVSLNPYEQDMCMEVAKELKRRKIFFAGIDLIGNFITEINITSPTLLVALAQNNGINSIKGFFDKIEANVVKLDK